MTAEGERQTGEGGLGRGRPLLWREEIGPPCPLSFLSSLPRHPAHPFSLSLCSLVRRPAQADLGGRRPGAHHLLQGGLVDGRGGAGRKGEGDSGGGDRSRGLGHQGGGRGGLGRGGGLCVTRAQGRGSACESLRGARVDGPASPPRPPPGPRALPPNRQCPTQFSSLFFGVRLCQVKAAPPRAPPAQGPACPGLTPGSESGHVRVQVAGREAVPAGRGRHARGGGAGGAWGPRRRRCRPAAGEGGARRPALFSLSAGKDNASLLARPPRAPSPHPQPRA